MSIPRRSFAAILLVGGIVGGLALAAYGYSIATGKFTVVSKAAAGVRTIRSGLSHIRSLTIVLDDKRMPPQILTTQDQIQGDRPGRFLNQTQSKWETGLVINPDGSFTLSHDIFKRPGATYYWEARGD
jgi:hypothetical protein